MNRILILGSGGAGKSTLARRLSRELALPWVSLDQHYWNPGWVESDWDEFAPRVEELCRQPRWVMDGNYTRILPMRLSYADAVIYLDVPRLTCMARALRRIVTGMGRVREEMAAGCPEHFEWAFFSWIWTYRAKHLALHMDMLGDWLGTPPQFGERVCSADGSRSVWWGRKYPR